MNLQSQQQVEKLITTLQSISGSLKTVQQDIQLLAESVCTLNNPKINLKDFQDDILVEIQTAKVAISESLSAINTLNGGEG